MTDSAPQILARVQALTRPIRRTKVDERQTTRPPDATPKSPPRSQENHASQPQILAQQTTKEDVFESLYKFAEVRREKSEDGKRNA